MKENLNEAFYYDKSFPIYQKDFSPDFISHLYCKIKRESSEKVDSQRFNLSSKENELEDKIKTIYPVHEDNELIRSWELQATLCHAYKSEIQSL